jgi:hypothetical protein
VRVWEAERLASFHTQVSPVDVTNPSQALDRALHIVRLDHDHKVDNRLGCEARDSGGANVLDRDRNSADCSGNTLAEPLELDRPRRVVDDDDRIRHRVNL